MFSVLVCCVLIIFVNGKPLAEKRDDEDWILDTNGIGQGYIGAKYESPDGWNAGAQAHVDLGKLPGNPIDGGRLTGGYDFGNGLTVNGNFGGTFNGGHFQPSGGIKLNYQFGKRMAKCIPMCYEMCKENKDCLQICASLQC